MHLQKQSRLPPVVSAHQGMDAYLFDQVRNYLCPLTLKFVFEFILLQPLCDLCHSLLLLHDSRVSYISLYIPAAGFCHTLLFFFFIGVLFIPSEFTFVHLLTLSPA